MFDCQSPPFTLCSQYVNLSLIMKNYRVFVGLNVVSSKSITMNDWGGGSWWQLQTQSCVFLPSHIPHWLRKHLAEAGGGLETKKQMRQVSAALIGGKRRVWPAASAARWWLDDSDWKPRLSIIDWLGQSGIPETQGAGEASIGSVVN